MSGTLAIVKKAFQTDTGIQFWYLLVRAVALRDAILAGRMLAGAGSRLAATAWADGIASERGRDAAERLPWPGVWLGEGAGGVGEGEVGEGGGGAGEVGAGGAGGDVLAGVAGAVCRGRGTVVRPGVAACEG